jgi:hypothetical protein
MTDIAERLAADLLKNLSKDDLLTELNKRGEVVEVATGGPSSWDFAGSAAIGRCLSCRFFTMRDSYKSGSGNCQIRAPGATGFPAVRAGAWCGEWQERLATQPRYHEPPIETVANHTVVPFILAAFDGIEKLAKHRLSQSTNRHGGARDTLREDAERITSLCKAARRCGLYPHALEEFTAALDEPMPFEVAATMKKLGARDE